ncbi:alpha/beta fold hydrolase [Streptosporangium sp. CA-135522]|uniref:alpha/beta fold hydrolase n=1 Tax=Streptosporangium sp. CA-135522 TaxID=3240072 RepID=UPI003D8CDB89
MGKVTSRDGTTIAFDRSGEGPAVILVGGAFSERAHPSLSQLAALLASDFTVYNYDRRGRGDSGDTAPYSVDREVEDLEALIADAGGSASVFGLSSGGALALEAATRGAPIAKLAVMEAPYIVDDSRPPMPENLVDTLSELISSDRRGDAVELFVTTGMNLPVEVVAQWRHAPMWPGFEGLAHTLVYDATLVLDSSMPAGRVSSIKVPTLLIDGGESPGWIRNAVKTVVEAVPGAEHRTLEGQDHFSVAGEALAPVLAEFFADTKKAN